MNYDIENDKLHEECGVFGIFSHEYDVALNTYWGIYALQHRGQESAGIALTDGCDMDIQRGMGLVNEVFRKDLPAMLHANIAIGHVRYSTTGSSLLINTQPLMVSFSGGQISIAHNGNLTNALAIREELEKKGSVFQTTVDTEVIIHLIARSQKPTIEEKLIDSLSKVEGAYSLVVMTENKLIGVRDPQGFRPLCIGKLNDGGWVIASESCALDVVGAEMLRDIEPGEMIVIDDDGFKSHKFATGKQAHCIFEYIYFARPDSIIDGQSVYKARFAMGRQLARESNLKADIVISVPDSGTVAALGFAAESGIPFAEGLMKNRYIGRTFIQPEQKNRDLGVRIKLNANKAVVEGKSIIMVDDSIVRGTTSGKIVKMLRDAGATAVHMCVSSPPIGYPCYYGIDTTARKELIASSKSVEEIRQYIGADSLYYISLEGLYKSVDGLKDEHMCYACFTSNYPSKIHRADYDSNKFVFECGGRTKEAGR